MRPRNNQKPPEVMTWGKATPALVISVIFDALRLMFEMFWFFGPALAAVICTVKAGGSAVAGGICTIAAGTAGFFGAGAIEAFGVVMAMAVGLTGWLVIGLILLMFNGRIFKENALWFGGSLLLSEIPIIGAIPALTITLWKMYGNQIRIEKVAFKKWEKENAATQLQERNRQIAAQAQSARQMQTEQQVALDTEWEGQMAQQEELEETSEDSAQDEEEGRAIAEATLPHLHLDTKPLPSSSELPPPLPQEYLRSVPPPLPKLARSVPPPLPGQTRAMPPPLPTGVPNYSGATPPPLPNLPQTEMSPLLQTNAHEVKEAGMLNIPIIDRGLMDLGISGPEKMAEFLNEKRKLPPDAPIYLYHGLNGGLGKALAVLESPQQGIKQISGPALAVFPVGQFWKPGDAGLRYSIPRGQIEFPGENNPAAQFQLDDKGVVLLRNDLDTLPFTKFDGEVMRTEGTETHQEWREINGRSKRVDVETIAPLTDKEIEVGRKIEEKMKEFSNARERKDTKPLV